MSLTQSDKKFWSPVTQVMDYIANVVIAPSDRVLEVGPGTAPFKRADVSVDFVDVEGAKSLVKCDIVNEPMPFKDKEFDFVFARHVLEDSYNPFAIIKEMSRVGKRGYIEVPSPMAELGRGVDGGSPPFRGYHHHRFIGWLHGKEFRLISKYAFLEYVRFDDARIDGLLKTERYWNTYYLWDGDINVNHIQSPMNFNIPRDYARVLSQAVDASVAATDVFFSTITAQGKAA